MIDIDKYLEYLFVTGQLDNKDEEELVDQEEQEEEEKKGRSR